MFEKQDWNGNNVKSVNVNIYFNTEVLYIFLWTFPQPPYCTPLWPPLKTPVLVYCLSFNQIVGQYKRWDESFSCSHRAPFFVYPLYFFLSPCATLINTVTACTSKMKTVGFVWLKHQSNSQNLSHKSLNMWYTFSFLQG